MSTESAKFCEVCNEDRPAEGGEDRECGVGSIAWICAECLDHEPCAECNGEHRRGAPCPAKVPWVEVDREVMPDGTGSIRLSRSIRVF